MRQYEAWRGFNLGAEVVDGGWAGWGPADTGGEYATRRPSEEEEAARRQGTRGRRAIRISTTGPLAPSLVDQVVNHVIVVGRVTGPVGGSCEAQIEAEREYVEAVMGCVQTGFLSSSRHQSPPNPAWLYESQPAAPGLYLEG